MSEDGISPLPFFPLEDSEKEADGASVVVDFDSHQDHDTYPITSGASPVNNELDMPAGLLWAKEKAMGLALSPHSSRVTYMDPRLPGSGTTSVRVIHPDAELGRSYSASRRPPPL